MYTPENNLAVSPKLWFVEADPIAPLLTSTNFTDPVSVIGPTFVVPKPTFVICMNSSFTLITSSEVIDEIPVKLNMVSLFVMLNSNSVVIGVNAIGVWITPSIDINAFSFFLNISNSWAFPTPVPVIVNGLLARASGCVLAICNLSLLILIA